jgi:hypothetical protein
MTDKENENYIPDEEVLIDWLGEPLSEDKIEYLKLQKIKLYGGTN